MSEPILETPTPDRFIEGAIKTGMGYASHLRVGEKGISATYIDDDKLSSTEVAIYSLDDQGNYLNRAEPDRIIRLDINTLGKDKETRLSSLEEISDTVKRLMESGKKISEIESRLIER